MAVCLLSKLIAHFIISLLGIAQPNSYYLNQYGGYSVPSNNATQVYTNLPIPETMDVENR